MENFTMPEGVCVCACVCACANNVKSSLMLLVKSILQLHVTLLFKLINHSFWTLPMLPCEIFVMFSMIYCKESLARMFSIKLYMWDKSSLGSVWLQNDEMAFSWQHQVCVICCGLLTNDAHLMMNIFRLKACQHPGERAGISGSWHKLHLWAINTKFCSLSPLGNITCLSHFT